MTGLSFIGLGGTDEVGVSSYLYLLKEKNLLIDAEHPPAAMVLTHAHFDHVGALPLITSRFPKLRIYCTGATARIAALVLADTLKVSTE